MGAIFAIGSIGVLLNNGIMVGCFQYFFYDQGLLKESFLTIWIHGTLEISAIVIAGAAGITMGLGLVFPGTLTRLQAFQISARRGLKIMLGIVPIFILAGFIEGYLTRYTDTPDWVRAVFILICLSFVLIYFVWYPWRLARKGFKNSLGDTSLPPTRKQTLSFDRILSSGEVFAGALSIFKAHSKPLLLTSLAASVIFCGLVFPTANELPAVILPDQSDFVLGFTLIRQYFFNMDAPFMMLINIFIYSIMAYTSLTILQRHAEQSTSLETDTKSSTTAHYLANFFKVMLAVILLQLLLMFPGRLAILLWIFVAPPILLWAYIMFKESKNAFSAANRSIQLIANKYGQMLGVILLFTAIGLLLYGMLDTVFVWFFYDILSWNLLLEAEGQEHFGSVFNAFASVFVLCVIFSFTLLGFGLFYYSLQEIQDAPSLHRRIQSIGVKRQIQGLERA